MPHPENIVKHQYVKGGRSFEESSRIGKMGAIASAKARREKATLKKALERVLNGQPNGRLKDALVKLGYDPGDISNADALMSTLMGMAIKGNMKAMELLLTYQFQVSEDERKTTESAARVDAMRQNTDGVKIESGDDDGGVVIYLPKLDDEPEEEQEGRAEEATEGVE